MTNEVLIPAGFNGPPTSGHGGYTSGLVARALGADGPVAVSLRMPPPLQTPMPISRNGDEVAVHLGSEIVATATPTTMSLDPPPQVPVAHAAAAALDGAELLDVHPFPTCYGCGPARAPGDGLRLFAGPIDASGARVHACAWTPRPEHSSDGTLVDPLFVWTAMDCPSSAPTGIMSTERAIVLARFAVVVEAPVPLGRTYAVTAALHTTEGRKHRTTIALHDDSGTRLARGEALWIELRQRGIR